MPQILENQGNELTKLGLEIFSDLYQEICRNDQEIKSLDKRIGLLCQQNEACQRLAKIDVIGSLTATALVSAIGDVHAFKNGRHLAAWLGLVPRQYSSGNKQMLLGISKRGDSYIRTLLIHGARAFISLAKRRSLWLQKLIERRGKQRAYVSSPQLEVQV